MTITKVIASSAIAAVAATSAFAGNLDAVVADEPIVIIAEDPMMPGMMGSLGGAGVVVPAVIALAILAAAASGGGSDGDDSDSNN